VSLWKGPDDGFVETLQSGEMEKTSAYRIGRLSGQIRQSMLRLAPEPQLFKLNTVEMLRYSIELNCASINFKSQSDDGNRNENIGPQFGYSLDPGTVIGWRNAAHGIIWRAAICAAPE